MVLAIFEALFHSRAREKFIFRPFLGDFSDFDFSPDTLTELSQENREQRTENRDQRTEKSEKRTENGEQRQEKREVFQWA